MTELLTPSNRSAWEAALETVSAERHPLPTAAVAALWSPDDCPVHLLPYLAYGLSVDLWREDWTETRKREAVRNALKLHRLKTTLAGVKAHVELVGCEVVKTTRPPARAFLYAAMTDAQRAAWLDSLPQVRYYPFVHTAVANHRQFASGPFGRFFQGVGFLRPNRGGELYGFRATYYADGAERDIAYDPPDESGTLRLRITRTAKRSWHGQGFFHDWLTRSDAVDNVVTVRLSNDVAGFAVSTGMEPVDVRPTRVMSNRIAPIGRSFFGSRRRARFLCATWAPNLVFDKVSLLDPSRAVPRRQTRSFHGHGRFGIKPFSAELRIDVPMRRPMARRGGWHGAGFRQAPDMHLLGDAIQAVRVSKAFRDTVLIDTTTVSRVQFGSGLRFGDFTFGEMRKNG